MNNSDARFPPLMNDGRYLTDYRSSHITDLEIIEQHGLSDVYDTHSYYTKNTDEIKNASIKNTIGEFIVDPIEFVNVDPFNQNSYWNEQKKKLGF